MIERRPFIPEDYRIGNEKAKGTSDYPTQGTSPRDRLLNPYTGKRRMGAHGSVETHGSIKTPEDALIEAEEKHLHGEKKKATKEGNNEDFDGDVEEVHDFDEATEQHDQALLLKSRGRKVGTEISKIGIGRVSGVENLNLRKKTTPRKYRGTQKPKYKGHGRSSRAL